MRFKLQPLKCYNVPVKLTDGDLVGIEVGTVYGNTGGGKLALVVGFVLDYYMSNYTTISKFVNHSSLIKEKFINKKNVCSVPLSHYFV